MKRAVALLALTLLGCPEAKLVGQAVGCDALGRQIIRETPGCEAREAKLQDLIHRDPSCRALFGADAGRILDCADGGAP